MANDISALVAIKLGSEYGILKDQALMFDPIFNVGFHDTDLNSVIIISTNQDYIPNFFGYTVNSISAIVGKNGVGKSTSLNYIKELFLKERRNSDPRTNDVVIFREANTIQIFINQAERNRYTIQNHTDLQVETMYFYNYPKVFDRIRNFTTVFYSNSLEIDLFEKEPTNYYNISTGYLKEQNGKINSRVARRIRSLGSPKRFRYTELKRQSEFLAELDRSALDIPFKGINEIILSHRDLSSEDLMKLLEPYAGFLKQGQKYAEVVDNEDSRTAWEHAGPELKRFQDFLQEEFLRFQPSGSWFFPENFGVSLTMFVLKFLFDDSFLNEIMLRSPQVALEIIKCFGRSFEPRRSNFIVTVNRLKDFLRREDLFGEEDYDRSAARKKMSPLAEKLNGLLDLYHFFEEHWEQLEYHRTTIVFQSHSELFLRFFDLHYPSTLDLPFLELKWPSLSAGEESLIAYFSRLFSVLRDIKSRHVLMLIDEGDLYFHPEWQRDYIYFLLQFLNSRLFEAKSVQLILTTHSPFIISDLPKEYINMLVKSRAADGNYEVKVTKVDQPTFGGNIHQLFTENFFLGDSLTSKFALQKIRQEIIDVLTSETVKRIDSAYLQQLISRIGEPVLKKLLEERLAERISQ